MNGLATTTEAAPLIARTARHFGHKVPVAVSDGYASIETRFGRAELTATEAGVSIALASPDAAALASLQQVMISHMTRFARTPVEFQWFERKEDGRA